MRVKEEIQKKANEFLELCKTHKVKYLYAFGSSTSNSFNDKESDIDLVIEINTQDPLEKGEFLIDLWDKFENFFNRKVDLLTNDSIKNPILRQNIEKTKVLIYDGKKPEVFS